MREVVGGMRQEMEQLRTQPEQMAHPGAEELSASISENAHLASYNELLQQRCEELGRGVDGGSATVEIRMLRGRVKTLEEAAQGSRASMRHALEGGEETNRLRGELAAVTSRSAEAGRASSGLVSQLQGRVTELTSQLATKSAECEALRAERDGGGHTRELQAKLATAEGEALQLPPTYYLYLLRILGR